MEEMRTQTHTQTHTTKGRETKTKTQYVQLRKPIQDNTSTEIKTHTHS